MRRSPAGLPFLALALAVAPILGCAAGGLAPASSSQPVARQAMAPEYRVFYDALEDYGDWILIEPYGFVFRPRVAWNQWRPFEDGFWAPTDVWGWVWISAEPFGWATYHYGQWFFDRFQGWVWTPGLQWMPGAVSWTIAGDFVGWSPLQGRPASRDDGARSEGTSSTLFAPLSRLGAPDLRTHLVTPAQIGPALAEAQPIRNFARIEGVTVNRGPSLELVERRAGPLARARIEDLVPVDLGRRLAGPPNRGPGGTRGEGGANDAADREALDLMRSAGERAAAEARRLGRLSGSGPAVLPLVRPILGPGPDGPADRRARRPARSPAEGAAPDSAR